MSTEVLVRPAREADLLAVKALLDAHRAELGFVPLPALRRPLERGWLHVAMAKRTLVGAIDWWARRDQVVVLYAVVVASPARGQGIGRRLLSRLIDWARDHDATEVRLKCPAELPANGFYARLGFQWIAQEPGKRRPLNCWALSLHGQSLQGPRPTLIAAPLGPGGSTAGLAWAQSHVSSTPPCTVALLPPGSEQ
jgi:GNAT superfamily N-acetyltransferase